MLNFEIINDRDGSIRERGYHFIGNDRQYDVDLVKKLETDYGQNMVDNLFDSLYDGWVKVCSADDGKLYGVDYRYTDTGYVPLIWQEVEPIARWCITKWCKSITDSGKDEYTGNLKRMKEKLIALYGSVPVLYDFRLLDDDGIIYAYGKSTDDSSFSPVDRYEPDYGCCRIEYKNPDTGKYELL